MVSVILPNYNHAKYLQERLDSIFSQRYKDFEVIILDDFSTDNSKYILDSYKNHPQVSKIIYNSRNSGNSYLQWYKGVEYAKGELVWIAESDDWSDSYFLEYLVPVFNNEDISLAFCQSVYVYGDHFPKPEQDNSNFIVRDGNEFISTEMLGGNAIVNASSVLFRKASFTKVMHDGYLDLKFCGDWLLWMQMMQLSNIAYFPAKMNYLRRHPGNITNKWRARGLDLTEGLKVYRSGKKMIREPYNKSNVYQSWLNRFAKYKSSYSIPVLLKVTLVLMIREPTMAYYILTRYYKSKLKKILR